MGISKNRHAKLDFASVASSNRRLWVKPAMTKGSF